jgi:L-amino acid N-acyltransferase YncA
VNITLSKSFGHEQFSERDVVFREYARSDFEDIVKAGYPFSLAKFGSMLKDVLFKFQDALERLETKRLVVYNQKDKKIVGIVTLKEIKPELWGIWGIFISPQYRGRGLSVPFYKACFSYLKRRGIRKAVGSVEIKNVPSVKTIERMWDGFFSQRYFECRGSFSHALCQKEGKLEIRVSKLSDRNALYQLFCQCANSDWRNFLEIDESNFLERIIPGATFASGIFKFLSKNKIIVAENPQGVIQAYAVIPSRSTLLNRGSICLYFFLSPKLSSKDALVILREFLCSSFVGTFREYSLFSINRNEVLLFELSDTLAKDAKALVFQNFVCFKRLAD